ncbi:hypothetical protein GOODEAATRI_002006, partial [Goodea atripinnis]
AHNSEIQLLGEAKRCRAELEQLQVEVQSLEEQEGPSEEPDGEVSKLRRQLLQAYNERKAAEEREHTARHELQWFLFFLPQLTGFHSSKGSNTPIVVEKNHLL